LRICLITSEIFAGRRRGGFGKLVRVIGREIVRKGYDVSVISWRDPGQEPPAKLDGMEILSYPYDFTSHSSLKHLVNYAGVIPLIRQADADVYLSIDCLMETCIAQRVMPDRKHVIWVQDPFDEDDHRLLCSVDPYHKFSKAKFWATCKLYCGAYARADLILTQARYYVPKIARLFRVDPSKVVYVPNPIEYVSSESPMIKFGEPTVCYLGRMDPQKRYWLFFELAKAFPDVKFVAMGSPSLVYEELYKRISQRYQDLENLEIMGFVDERTKSGVLSKSRVMVMPSIREGLPLAFLEALAHRCTLLSSVNPDELTARYGYWARDDDFVKGLHESFSSDLWKAKSDMGYRYVKKTHSLNKVVTTFLKTIPTGNASRTSRAQD